LLAHGVLPSYNKRRGSAAPSSIETQAPKSVSETQEKNVARQTARIAEIAQQKRAATGGVDQRLASEKRAN